jgi:hypothetical protein
LGHEDDDREDEIVDIVHSPTLRQEEEGDGDTVDEDGDETSSDGTTLSENTSGIQAPPTLITATRANDEFHKDSNKVKYNSGNHDDDNPSHPVTATDLGQPNSTHAAQQPPPPSSSSPFDQDVDEHSYKKVLQSSSSSSLESELKSNKEEILNDKYQYHPAEEDTTLLLGDSIIVTDDHTEDGSATTNNNDGMNHPHRSITTPVIKENDDKEEEESERRNVRDIVMQDEGERGNDVTTIDVVEDGDETALRIDDISSDISQRRSSTEETSSSSSSSPDAMTTTITSTTEGGGEQKINIQYDDPSTLSSSSNTINKDANREFVTGLDDVDKLFESVEVPDELDVGADGSSMQEVLVGQALKIIMKKVKGLGGIIKLKFDKVAMPVVKKALPQLGLFGGEDDEGDDTDFDAVLFESLVNGSDEEKMTSLTIDKKEEGVVTSAAAAAKNLNDKLKNVRDKVKEVPLFKSDEAQRVFKFTTKKLEQGKQLFNNLLSIFEGEEEDEDVVNFDLSNMNLDDILSLDKGTQP